ncbi:MAG: Ig domain-containing protein [Desulfuromonadaceae bacterium]
MSQRILPQAETYTYYSFQLECVGLMPNEVATWSLSPVSGALPPGLTLSPTGLISGTPTYIDGTTQTYQFLVDVTHEII